MAVAYEHEMGPRTRTEYEALVRRGAFEDEPIELLYGRLVSMSPIGGPHVYSVKRLAKLPVQGFTISSWCLFRFCAHDRVVRSRVRASAKKALSRVPRGVYGPPRKREQDLWAGARPDGRELAT